MGKLPVLATLAGFVLSGSIFPGLCLAQPVMAGALPGGLEKPQLDMSAPDRKASPLEGHLRADSLDSELSSGRSYGLVLRREGKTDLPARVVKVELGSLAAQRGVLDGDRILKATLTDTELVLTVERAGRVYQAKIERETPQFRPMVVQSGLIHPFPASVIEHWGPKGVLQGKTPNCWFQAALMAVAAIPQGQSMISDMIVRNPDTTYGVTFRGDSSKRISVSSSELMGRRLLNPAPWANVIEVAEHQEFPDNDEADSPARGSPKIKTGLSILTGHQSQFLRPESISTGELEKIISGCVERHVPIIIATKSPQETGGLPQVIVPNHAYAILSFDPGSQSVTLRNPLGDKVEKNMARRKARYLAQYPGSQPGPFMFFSLPDVGEEREGVRNLGDGLVRITVPALQRYARYIAWSSL